MFPPAAHRLLRHSGVETGEPRCLSRIKVEFIGDWPMRQRCQRLTSAILNRAELLALRNFKRRLPVLPAPLSPIQAVRSMVVSTVNIWISRPAYSKKDVFSFDYEFHKLNRLCVLAFYWKRSHAKNCSRRFCARRRERLSACAAANHQIVGDDQGAIRNRYNT